MDKIYEIWKTFDFSFGHIFEKLRFGSNFRKNFGQIFENFQFWSKFPKISISFDYLVIFRLSDIFGKKLDLGQIFEKFPFWSNFRKKFYFGENFRKFRKISIEVKFSKNFDFGQIFEKISILVKIFENFEKFRFWIFPK